MKLTGDFAICAEWSYRGGRGIGSTSHFDSSYHPIAPELSVNRTSCAVPTPRPGTARERALVKMSGPHFIAKRFSNSSCDSLAPSSVSATDLAFVAGFEM